MNWIERWEAISARIVGLIEAGRFLMETYAILNQNTGAVGRILKELRQIHGELIKLHKNYHLEMPSAATTLKEYCGEPMPAPWPSGDTTELQPLVQLQLFRARFDYLIQDSEIEGRNTTELAFEHLQRLIVIDEQVRGKWKNAFEIGEISCEKLGAVHLLAHGIWAFKVKGKQAETDLVYGETEISSNAAIADPRVAGERAAEARRQTNEYAGGILGDIELKRTRYIVLVAGHQQIPPNDVVENGVCYRHNLVSCRPEVPSKRARAKE